MPKCHYCGKIYNWKQAKAKEEALDGCKSYCSFACCQADYPDPMLEGLECPCY